MSTKGNIIIIEKDKEHRNHLKNLLEREGYKLYEAENSMEAFRKLESKDVDLIISDYYLNDMRGAKFHQEVDEVFDHIPIIFLSDKADAETIANILEYPCADYMIKPIVFEELLARIMRFLDTEYVKNDGAKLKAEDLVLDTQTFKAYRKEKELELSPTEFSLLKYLMQNKGIVLTRRMILQKVWGYSYDVSSRIVDVYIGYLRKKIDDGHKNKLIQTVPGFGYRISKKD